MAETCLDHYQGESFITYATDEQKWKNKLRRQIEQYPDEIKVVRDEPDGVLIVQMPYSWLRAPAPKRTRVLTDEQRAELAARMEKMRSNKTYGN